MPIHRLYPNVKQAIRSGDFSMAGVVVRDWALHDLIELLTNLMPSEQMALLREVPPSQAISAFQYLAPSAQERLLGLMTTTEKVKFLNEMTPDDRTVLLEELPETESQEMLGLLHPEERAVAESLLQYPEDSIGRLMTPNYLAVREKWTVGQVLDYVREHGRNTETLNAVYVINEIGELIDDMRIRQFLLAPLSKTVSELMDRKFLALRATDNQETAVLLFRREDRTVLPVVNDAGKLVGIVTIDDVLDVAEEEATEDIHKLGGMEALDEPYMQITFLRMVRKRAGWLVMLFLGEMLTATAMGFFQREIERAVVLALFIPLMISSGGNSGSQAATLVIRALALSEVGLADWWRVLRREILSGLALGAVLGLIGFFRISIWSLFSDIYGPHWLLVAITVGLTLIGIVLWGTLTGCILPFVLRRLGFDPATSSAPFVATLVDVTGLIIYFSVASLILKGTLL
jgi:magnesium transporter